MARGLVFCHDDTPLMLFAPSRLELDVLRWVHLGSPQGVAADFFAAVSFLGSGWMLLALLPMLAAVAWRRFALFAIGVAVSTSAVVSAIKLMVGRVRPCNALDWCGAVAVTPPTDYSFPSGHAAGSFAFAAFVFGLDRRLGSWAFGWAALVALSRVALGVHYPTDVLAGAVLGTAIGSFGARVYRRGAANTREPLDPRAVHGGE